MPSTKKREPVSHNLSVRFREAEVEAVGEEAFEEDMSMGAWIRQQILKILAKRGRKIHASNGTSSETQ